MEDQSNQKPKKGFGRIIGGIILFFFLLFMIRECNRHSDNQSSVNTSDTAKASADTNKIAVDGAIPPENWTYDVDNSDKMDNTKVYTAACKSTGTIELAAPYEGENYGYIHVRKGWKHHSNEVYITVDKGQFMYKYSEGSVIKVKFDQSGPVSFSFLEASDGSTGIIFLEDSVRFLEKLKKSKHVIIEAEFFDNGYKQLEFNTDGLKW